MSERNLLRLASRGAVGEIDREKGIVYGVSVVAVGEAKGHGVYVDETMVDQVVSLGQQTEPIGLKSRWDHPSACSKSIGSYTGRFHNFRRDENKARADLHLAEVAAKAPDGDLRNYILDLAEEDPEAFATSIVFRHAEAEIPDPADKGTPGQPPEDDPFWFPHARVDSLHHCDVVDEGAANDGLFGRPDYMAEQAEAWAREHPSVVERILATYHARKQNRETKKMEALTLVQTTEQLTAALATVETGKTELATATTKIEELTAAVDAKGIESLAAGKTEVFALIKTRIEKYEDAGFVLDNIELSDEEMKDAYIERLKKGDADPGETVAAEFGEGGGAGGDGAGEGDEGETFEAKVAELTKGGMKRGAAISECTAKHPKLHAAYIARTNKERKQG